MKNIADRLNSVLERIRTLESRYQRPADSVQLIAVSKTRPADQIEQALLAGQSAFAENYLQEALVKIEQLQQKPVEWHFIGPVQSNKTTTISQHFHWCHSVDRLKIAQRLDASRPADADPLNICVQVNISQEQSKSGITVDETRSLCEKISELPRLKLRGLMCMPKPSASLEEQRQPFRQLFQLQQSIVDSGMAMDTMSIGTTQDLEAAIAEGATMVRIGTAIFGERVAKTAAPH